MFQEIPLPFTIPFGCAGRSSVSGISTFSIMLVIAFLMGSYLCPRELSRKRLNPEHADWSLLLAVFGAIVGSKIGFVFEVWSQIWVTDKSFGDTLYHVLGYWRGMGVKYPNDPNIHGMWETLFSGSGLVFYGGFVVSFSSIYVYLRYHKLEIWRFGDSFMTSLALGYAIGRLGCLVSGDGCYGHAASVNIPGLTMIYEPLSIFSDSKTCGTGRWNVPVTCTYGVRVWNTPVMEAIASFGLFAILHFWGRFQNFKPGMLTASFLVYNGVSRFMVEFIRLNDAVIPLLKRPDVNLADRYTKEGLLNWHWYGFNQSQLVAFTIFAVGVAWIVIGKLYEREAPPDKRGESTHAAEATARAAARLAEKS